MSSIHDPRYQEVIRLLKTNRELAGLSQQQVADRLGQHQSYIAKIETGERRLDVIELIDLLSALESDAPAFLQSLGWMVRERSREEIAFPVRGSAVALGGDCQISLAWNDRRFPLVLQGVQPDVYNALEDEIVARFRALNTSSDRNRDTIAWALRLAITRMPKANPSDIYHHIVYRLYMREYNRSDPAQSWVRAGGEAIEVFLEAQYSDVLQNAGIEVRALITRLQKRWALEQMGLSGLVGDSKLDLVLVGTGDSGEKIVFGGIHAKASLAERVSDDVPCSQAMMRKGLWSCLFTFDAKSFPPPTGDLVNRGELGTEGAPSDKRRYITEHGSFSACVCYNTRSSPSPSTTVSGRQIYVSTMDPDSDPLPELILRAWTEFRQRQ